MKYRYFPKLNEQRRTDMPQISDDSFEDFLEYLQENGVLLSHSELPFSSIQFYQTEFNQDKIKDLAERKIFSKNFIVDENNYLLDGNHRVLALKELGIKNINVIKTNKTIDELIDLASKFDSVAYKDIQEKKFISALRGSSIEYFTKRKPIVY